MKNVIKLLEKMGKDVSMLNATELEQAIAEAGLMPELSAAVKVGDVDQLEMLLGKNGDIFCSVKEPGPEPEPKKQYQKEENVVNY